MKKIMTITVELDTEHPEKENWREKRDFIEDEFDQALAAIADWAKGRLFRNCSGKTNSGAAKYKVHIKTYRNDTISRQTEGTTQRIRP